MTDPVSFISKDSYRRHSNRVQKRNQRVYKAAREISHEMPGIVNPPRRRRALASLRIFLETYFAKIFNKPWSDDHLQVISKLEAACIRGRQMCLAMPRGSGKTSLVECAAIWAIFNGHRRYIVIIGAEKEQAEDILESIVEELRSNELLLEDFPEICFPFHSVGRQQNKRPLFLGKDINLKVHEGTIRFADIPGSRAAGARIRSVGITGNIRGKKSKKEGENVRPDMVMFDDPQTDESAASELMTKRRLKKMKATALGLAGPGQSITAVACVTVIEAGDLADQLLDHKLNPQWRGMRFKLMETWPDSERWDEYYIIRAQEMLDSINSDEDPEGPETPLANAYYAQHQTEMDHGGYARWSHRFNARREISAIQHAMNLRQDLGAAEVEAEYQNQPQKESTDDINLTIEEITSRLSHVPRGIVPRTATRLVAFVDCHDALLYWLVLAVDEHFSAWVIDYGTYPDQKVSEFTLRSARHTIAKAHRDINNSEALHYAAVQATLDRLLHRSFKREDGSELQISRLLIDANWGPMTATTYLAIAQSEHRARVLPSHGRGYSESETPISGYKLKPGSGTQRGEEWMISPNPQHRAQRVIFDSNHWKTKTAKAIKAAPGTKGALMLFGNNPHEHRQLAEHWTSETATEVSSQKRRIHKWKLKVNRDNHSWDCVVGSMANASTLGIKVVQATPAKPTNPNREASLSERRAAGRNLSRRSRRDDA